ncbi:2-amino-4-hydroxy-6-hydroxymethyldihydropteridine diphosphokinase [Cellulomonas sp. PS-H5]|uniref:2-amino-4-hydroxy-6- hydroxymethyldihydropteridine diphosphokinase n=1 Tax=Cellulomonas sp. PS-H5 TaxID=2820400 RepID=UPI001C4FA295|nr:2-amino-4-hydroxy-6-hydroxymethyldihydropteridine diphosphokinase [Cellulomonas sp. PS-H5]MBW0256360.1 2-amino-4-hydroxy-6-hydroxymethyldihydropteridine diphosphokinase [Cellulomonas sp. PS-H5]
MSDEADVPGRDGHRLDRIRLTGVTATGYHGVFEHERREGQTFVADVVAHLDTRRAAATDDLRHTLNYGVLAEQVVTVLAGEPADLVETVAERIAATVLAHPQVQCVDVAVHKPQAPITVPFGDVVVEVRRDRTWLPAAEPVPDDAPRWLPEGAGAPALPAAEPAPVPPTAPAEPVAPVAPGATAVLPLAAVPVPGDLDLPPAPPGPVPSDPADAWDADEVVEAELVADALDAAPDAPVEVVLAIGSNLGAAQDTLRDAVADLAAVPGLEVLDVSALARTAPVGGPEQPDFLNAVLIARTTLSPRDLLRATSEVERRHGRERLVHWGPRTLDVDIIVYGDVSAVTDDLELPHPRAHERAFVLQPWAQVQPDAVLHGLGGGPVAQLAATAPDRDGVRWLALDWLTAPVPAAQPDPGGAGDDDGAAGDRPGGDPLGGDPLGGGPVAWSDPLGGTPTGRQDP